MIYWVRLYYWVKRWLAWKGLVCKISWYRLMTFVVVKVPLPTTTRKRLRTHCVTKVLRMSMELLEFVKPRMDV